MNFRVLPVFLTPFILSCNEKPDCTDYKTGKFYMYSPITKDKIIIERNDTIQVETNANTGEVSKYKINWMNACEYKVTNLNGKTLKDGIDSFFSITPINVSIVSTGKDYYVFHIKVDSADKHVEYSDTLRIER
jgi:hypothetical protein